MFGPTASSTEDRLRRLVDGGAITGSIALLSAEALGYPITAFVRLKHPSGNYQPLHHLLDTTPEFIEAHHATGDDRFIPKLLARSTTDLERLAGKIAGLGSITTSVVYSSPSRAASWCRRAGGELKKLPHRVTWTTRLRKDAALHELPPERTGRRGRPREKGDRLPSLAKLPATAVGVRPKFAGMSTRAMAMTP
jgi:DNA-binding Lrp family transcriptional regulator